MARPVKLYFDGGCRPNPGPMETAIVARGQVHYRADHGPGDNNDAEWLALLEALSVAQAMGERDIILIGDSALVIGQATGAAPCRSLRFRAALARFQELAAGFASVRLRLARRSHNLAGIALERIHGRI